MPLSEFALIDRFFKRETMGSACPASLGIGDDCAIFKPPADNRVAVSSDTLVEGVHFLPGTDPETLGHKALAVNLSDLAAMGARPAWATLALTLPNAEASWLAAFAKGFFSLADTHNLQLIGGDTTRGPLTVTVTVMGLLPEPLALTRSGARPGDSIYVTGSIGEAGLGLMMAKDLHPCTHEDSALRHYLTPQPRVAEGQAILPFASSCIDVSDGLVADLRHVLASSGVGASIQVDQIPVSPEVQAYMDAHQYTDFAISAGDDYELCFTVAEDKEADCLNALANASVPVTRIGRIEAGDTLRLLDADGQTVAWSVGGYQHQWESGDNA